MKPKLTIKLIHAAATDAGNRSMRRNGRSAWTQKDYNVAVTPQLSPDRTRILIPPGDPAWTEFLRSLPNARWQPLMACWSCDATPGAAWRVLSTLSNNNPIGETLRDMGQRFKSAVRCAYSLRDAPIVSQPQVAPRLSLWRHQRYGYHFAYDLDASLLAMRMGEGKSAVAIALIQNWDCRRILILCPTSVRAVWRREFNRHATMQCGVLILDGHDTVAKKKEQAARHLSQHVYGTDHAVVVLNYEAAWREPFAAWALQQNWDCVILDESHRIAAHDSKVSKFCAKLGRVARRRLCLTGTPLTQTPLSIFGQFRFLDPGLFGTSWTQFCNRYADRKVDEIRKRIQDVNEQLSHLLAQPPIDADLAAGLRRQREGLKRVELSIPAGWITGTKNTEELQARMALITYRCRPEDVHLDLPPLVMDERTCALSAKARRAYNEMEEELIADLGESRVCTASTALTKMLRLQQLTSGYLPCEDGGPLVRLDDGKAELLKELLEDCGGEPFVVFCRFRPDLERVREVTEALGLRYGELSGERKDALTEQATMRPDIDVAGVQVQSGGLGIDLTAARYAAFYSPSLSLVEMDQAVARLHRPGQKKATAIFYLLAENSIDRRVYAALRDRREVIEAVMKGLSERSSAH